jgi:hypothetical protein
MTTDWVRGRRGGLTTGRPDDAPVRASRGRSSGFVGTMSLVLFAEAIEQQAASRAVGAFGNGKVVDRHIPGAEDGALKGRQHIAA